MPSNDRIMSLACLYAMVTKVLAVASYFDMYHGTYTFISFLLQPQRTSEHRHALLRHVLRVIRQYLGRCVQTLATYPYIAEPLIANVVREPV